jgi:outer membrane biosynthesis protein TonB
MASRALHGEDYAGLALAAVLHAGLLALLIYQPGPARQLPAPERITVTLSEETGLQSASPEPQAQAAPPAAPVIAPEPEPEPAPQPRAAPLPKSLPKALPEPSAAPAPRPRPAPKAVPRMAAPPAPRPAVQPRPAQPRPATSAPRPAAQSRAAPVQRPAGASRIADDFLKGVPGAQASGAARNPPAATIGPAVRSALASAISRELKPHWAAPQGAEAELLVSILTFDLAANGSLAGSPRLVRQEGITAANRSQAARHAEQAIRAVRLAAPFDLPAQHYDAWKRVAAFRFDKRLSQ